MPARAARDGRCTRPGNGLGVTVTTAHVLWAQITCWAVLTGLMCISSFSVYGHPVGWAL